MYRDDVGKSRLKLISCEVMTRGKSVQVDHVDTGEANHWLYSCAVEDDTSKTCTILADSGILSSDKLYSEYSIALCACVPNFIIQSVVRVGQTSLKSRAC